jgi:hypothetical protein
VRAVFERRTRLGGAQIVLLVTSIAAASLFVGRSLNHRAPAAIAVVGAWVLLCALVAINLPRLVYLRVTDDLVVERRYLFIHRIRRQDVHAITLTDLLYPGARGVTLPTAVLVDAAQRGLAITRLSGWTDDQIASFLKALNVPVDDHRGSPTSVDEVEQTWPGALSRFGRYYWYIGTTLVLVFVLLVIAALTWILIAHR